MTGLHPRLVEAIAHRLGWSGLRPVQARAAEAIGEGCNAVVLAPTAGGKTEAAIFPVLSLLIANPAPGVGAVYVAPLKALLNNQAERLGQYAELVGLRAAVWHGDTSAAERRRFLSDPADLLLTTPESLEGFFLAEGRDPAALFAGLRALIVDEVHALVGADRGSHLLSVIERVAALSSLDVLRVGLSATVGNPAAILDWLAGSSQRPRRLVAVEPAPRRRQLLAVHRPEPGALAADAAKMAEGNKTLLFCQSRADAELMGARLRRVGVEVAVHHSALSAHERSETEARFREAGAACVVSTSTLELGIDVGDLDRVLQVDAPDTVASFLQRMGRTGRREGQTANLAFLCGSPWAVLQAAALVSLAREGRVESVRLHTRRWAVLLHQLLALSLERAGVSDDEAWAHLSRVPDFSGVHRPEFDRLIAWMLRDGSLRRASGRLLLGEKAERRYGRRHFAELYAVFSTPESYAVLGPDGHPLGTLSQAFVDRLVEDGSCFLLGGRAWTPTRIQHGPRVVQVQPAASGRGPTWGGITPQFLEFELCQRMRDLLLDEGAIPWLHPSAAEALAGLRAELGGTLRRGGLEQDGDELRWWTFAGGRINLTLRHALLATGPEGKIIPDNHGLKIRGWTRERLDTARERLGERDLWEDEALWREVAEGLPSYRLSKFQPLMPPWVEREVLAEALLDIAGAWRWLSAGEVAAIGPVRPVVPAELERAPAPVLGAVRPEAPVAAPTALAVPGRPEVEVRWVADAAGLEAACAELGQSDQIGLDVETTLVDQALCLVQLASARLVVLIDPLQIEDLGPLARLLADGRIVKIIHNASFERRVLGRYGVSIDNVFDTLTASRRLRAQHPRHNLKEVCQRELGVEMDKAEQTSDWARRPLSRRQLAYAALDAEVLVRLYAVFAAETGRQVGLFG